MKIINKPKYCGVVFFVDNIKKSKDFYTKILGQKIEMDFGRCVGFIEGFSIWERSYAHKMIGLKEDYNKLNKNNVELYFEIEDLEILFEKLKSNEVKFVHNIVEQPWGQRCFRVYDPDNPGFSDLPTMEPGYGYWINTTEACMWTLP